MNKIYSHLIGRNYYEEDNSNRVIGEALGGGKHSLVELENGKLLIRTGRDSTKEISDFLFQVDNNPFTKEAIDLLQARYKLENSYEPWEYIYGVDDLNQLNTVKFEIKPEKIEVENLINNQRNKFKKYPFRYPSDELIYFGINQNKTIISLVSGYMGDLGAIELTAETLVQYQGKGYAKINTYYITEHLLGRGFEVYTTNGCNNEASIATVESLGFKRLGKRIVFLNKE